MYPDPWYFVTLLGEAEIWVWFMIGLMVIYTFLRYKTSYAKKPRMKTFKNFLFLAVISLLIAYVMVTGLKFGTAIPRPCIACPQDAMIITGNCNLYCPHDDSFPSGHATIIFTFLTSLLLVIRKKWVIPLYVIGILVGYSRDRKSVV